MTILKSSLELIAEKSSRSHNRKRGWCERHNHYCPQLDVQRTAFLAISAKTMVTAEEKCFLSNAGAAITMEAKNEDQHLPE